MLKQTPLYEKHQQLNARFTEFGGWDMPVQYTSIIEEHQAVRTAAGIFDTSHMGTFIISGGRAAELLNKLTTADVPALVTGQAKYALFLNEKGGVIDDLIIYRRAEDFMLVVNAGNRENDYRWIEQNLLDGVKLEDISASICLLALQGPRSQEILQKLVNEELSKVKYFTFLPVTYIGAAPAFSFAARTGYTGEDGFELFISKDAAPQIWDRLLAEGVKPCGLGCRDTLRLEACMPLHGHEISEEITPLEAGLGWAIFWDKDFTGKEALLAQKAAGLKRFLTAVILDSGIPRSHCEILAGGTAAGQVVSGTFSPTLRKGIGLGYIDRPAKEGEVLEVVVHGSPKRAVVVKRPFYKRPR